MRTIRVASFALLASICGISSNSAVAQCKLKFDFNQWEEVQRDDFSGTTLNTNVWHTTPVGLTDGNPYFGWGSEFYDSSDPSLVTVSGGQVHLKSTRWFDADGVPQNIPTTTFGQSRTVSYRSGMLVNKESSASSSMFYESYGAWEASIKLPSLGWPAFWLSTCPTEIDIIDGVDNDNSPGTHGLLSGVIDHRTRDGIDCGKIGAPAPILHGCGGFAKIWAPATQTNAYLLTDSFHKYTVVWTPEQVTFFLDDREIQTIPNTMVVTVGKANSTAFYPHLLLTMQRYLGETVDIDATMDVDWVRILKPKANANGERNYSVPTNTYKTDNEFINHDISVTGIEPNAIVRNTSLVSSKPRSISVNSNNSNQVFYRGDNDRMHLATKNGNNWDVIELPFSPGWEVSGDVTYHAGLDYIIYNSNGSIQAYYYDGSDWQHTWITPFLTGGLIPAYDKASIATRTIDNQIVYIGHDHLLHYCSPTGPVGTPWQINTLSTFEGNATLASGNVLLYNNSKNIIYRGDDGRIQIYWWNGSIYQHSWIDDNWSTDAYKVSSEPKSMALGNDGIYYIGEVDHKIHLYHMNASGTAWVSDILPDNNYQYGQNVGYPNANLAHGGIAINSDDTRVTYLGYDARIQGMYKDGGGWHHYWIDNYWNTGEFLSFDNTMLGHSSLASDNLTSYYCGRDKHLRYFAWEPCERLADFAACSSGVGSNVTLHRGTSTTLPQTIAEPLAQVLTISPNPTTGKVEVNMPSASTKVSVPYTVTSLLGKVVQQGNISANHKDIDLTACSPGVYVVTVQTAKQTYRTKIVKQ